MSAAPLARAGLLSVALLLVTVAPLAAQSQVWTVAKTGPADFTDIQSAVDAAGPGDLIAVSGGAYDSVVIEGKGITLVGEPGTGIIDLSPTVGATQAALTIRAVPAGQTCIVSGFQVFLGHAGPASCVAVDECAGAVWLQDLFVDSYGAASLRSEASTSVVVVDSLLQTNAGAALPDGTPESAPGAWVLEGSTLHGYEAEFIGSHSTIQFGGAPTPNGPADGGDGLIVSDSVVRLSGGFAAGAGGTSLFVDGCQHGGDGGNGLVLLDAGAFAVTRGSAVSGGGPGLFNASCAAPTAPGVALLGDASQASLSDTTPRSLHLPARVSPGEALGLELAGDPGDLAFLFLADAPAHAGPAAGITLHLDSGSLKLLTALPMPTGTRTLNLSVPALPVGVSGILLPIQAAMLSATGTRHETGPRALAVVPAD